MSLLRRVFTLLFWIAAIPYSAQAAEKTRPNIVVIIADDLGYGDVSCNGATAVQTPNIDALASAGLRFTSGYSSASTCTPTRFSLMTGTYAFRHANTGIAPPNAPAIIQPGTETIASLLKRAGYKTAVVGKWHLGFGVGAPEWNGELKPGPLEIGFDHCFVLPTTNDRVPQVIVEDHRVRNLEANDPLHVSDKIPSPDHPTGLTHRKELKMDWSHGHNNSIHNGVGRIGFYTGGHKARFRDEDLADVWLKHSIEWIEQNRKQSFFLFFASHDLHVPRVVNERFQGSTTMGPRGDAIVEFDWSVGELMKALDRLHLKENTLVIVCSDNGPVLDDGYQDQAVEKLGDHKPAGIFRGRKAGVYEGGTRTPFITCWPGQITPGVSNQIVCTIDLAASLAALTGQVVPQEACLDSMNVLDAMLGRPPARGREELVQQDNSGKNFGLRMGNWKLVRQQPGKRPELYDLQQDPGETTNLAASHPQELKRLTERLDTIIAHGRTRVAEN